MNNNKTIIVRIVRILILILIIIDQQNNSSVHNAENRGMVTMTLIAIMIKRTYLSCYNNSEQQRKSIFLSPTVTAPPIKEMHSIMSLTPGHTDSSRAMFV